MSTNPTYALINSLLQQARTLLGPAEVHGVLCGLLCSTEVGKELWLEQVQDFVSPHSISMLHDALEALYTQTQQQLNSTEFGLQLLLPDDSVPLALRTAAVGEWCQGFLSGLGLGNLPPQDTLPEDVRELIHDFREIACASYASVHPSERDEKDYMEIIEYIRLGVILIQEHLRPLRPILLKSH